MDQHYSILCDEFLAKGFISEQLMDQLNIPLSKDEQNRRKIGKPIGNENISMKSRRMVYYNNEQRILNEQAYDEELKKIHK